MFNSDIFITRIHSVIRVESRHNSINDYSGKLAFNELILKLDGKANIQFGLHSFQDEKGSLRFLPKTEQYVKYKAEIIEQGNCIDIFFDTDAPISSDAFSIKCKNYERMSALFKHAEITWRQKRAGYVYTVMGYLYEILGLICEEGVYVPQGKLEKVKVGADYIIEHFTEDLNIEDVSNMCGISHTYFKKIFKDVYNMTPKAYIINFRIQYACELLKSGKYRISDVADIVGYRDVYYFSKSFKKIKGISPSEYINNCFLQSL